MSLSSQGSNTPDVPGVSSLVPIPSTGPCAVYRGRHLRTGRGVVVKILPAAFDRVGRTQFEREAQRVTGLGNEPTLLRAEEVGTLPDGRPFLVTELCVDSLTDRVMRGGPFAAADVADMGRRLAAALARLHGIAIVHGAVTPHNVLFRRTGQLVLADIGTASRAGYVNDPDYDAVYAAPETLCTGLLSPATDLYGLGATLFMAIVGAPAFPGRPGEHPSERVLRVMGEPAPAVDPHLAGDGLASLLADLLATAPENRPRSAAAVAARCASLVTPPAPRSALSDPRPAIETIAAPWNDAADVAGAAADREADASVRTTRYGAPAATSSLTATSADDPDEASTDWSGLLDEVLCEPESPDSPELLDAQPSSLIESPTGTRFDLSPISSGRPRAERHEPSRTVLAGRTRALPARLRDPRVQRGAGVLGAAVVGSALLLLVANVLGSNSDDSAAGAPHRKLPTASPLLSAPPTASASARTTAPTSAALPVRRVAPSASRPSSVSPAPAQSAATSVQLLSIKDAGRSVRLRWSGDPTLQYAVVVAGSNQAARVVIVNHARTALVPVTPGRPYCLLVQATNGSQVSETDPRPIRGASCHA